MRTHATVPLSARQEGAIPGNWIAIRSVVTMTGTGVGVFGRSLAEAIRAYADATASAHVVPFQLLRDKSQNRHRPHD